MSVAEGQHYDEENLLLDRETLAGNIDTILGGGPLAPDVLAGLFVELRQAMESGLTGINRTRETLALASSWHTSTRARTARPSASTIYCGRAN